MAEIAFVGRAPNVYAVFLGGNPEGTRLNALLTDKVQRKDLVAVVTRLLAHYRSNRKPGERFGDFCARAGLSQLRKAAIPA